MKTYIVKDLLSHNVLNEISDCCWWNVSFYFSPFWKSVNIFSVSGVHEACMIKQGKPLCHVFVNKHHHEYNQSDKYEVLAPVDGIYYHMYKSTIRGANNDAVFYQFDTYKEFADYCVDNFFSYQIKEDEFDDSKQIIWKQGAYLFSKGWNKGYVSFDVEGNATGIFFKFSWDTKWRKRNEINVGDTFTILFDNKDKLSYVVKTKPKRASATSKNFQLMFPLTENALELLASEHIVAWKMEYSTGDEPDVSSENNEFDAAIFCSYIQKNLELFAQCGYHPEEKDIEKIQPADSKCFVYLMLDEANGYFKIGISNHPEYREHTLQSEKPSIRLLKAKEFPTRVIAEAIETALHKAYGAKRLRGEWFNLDAKEVEDVITTLS